jgi:RND family efflux transporter MFP subunit
MYNIRYSIMKLRCKDGFQFDLKSGSMALGALILFFLAACNNQPETNRNEIETPVSVREIHPTQSIIKYFNTSGNALPTSSAELNSEMSGLYKLQTNPRTGRLFKLGDAVKKDEVIIRLEDKEYENNQQIESRKLNLDISEQEKVKQEQLLGMGGSTESQIRSSELNIINARYQLANANINLEKMNVKAPFDGVITNLPHYTPDVKVASNQPMVGIMNYANLFMEINLPESAISYIQVNQPVNITHYTLQYDTLRGVISELSPAISSETRTFKGKIQINNSALKLHAGMFVNANVVIDRSDNVIVIPKSVLQTQRDRKFVYIVERNVAVRRTLTIGIEDDDNVEILEGLNENDQLIVRGYETLRENSRVRILR